MNVLFYLDHSVASGFGGEERITGAVAHALRIHQIKCYYVYRNKTANDSDESLTDIFSSSAFLVEEDLRAGKLKQLIINWDIDVVVVQSLFDIVDSCRKAIDLIGSNIKLVFVHHYNAGCEFGYKRWQPLWEIFYKSKVLSEKVWAFKQLIRFPQDKKVWNNKVKTIYESTYNKCDNVVLLSSNFLNTWKCLSKSDGAKISVIPNMLSIENVQYVNVKEKDHIVLIVSRLEEKQKRIFRALRIWFFIEKLPFLKKWKLVIVGDGPNAEEYKSFCNKYLTRCQFEGWQDPICYYKKAAIFMMTSAYEGWGLTLTEAQQFGSVPIVLDTFASASDIVKDNKNGILTKSYIRYVFSLIQLMLDNPKRYRLGVEAVSSSARFRKEIVVNKWLALLGK